MRTARAYVISTAKRLGGLIDADDLREWGAEEWMALYEEALSDAEMTLGMRRKLARALRDFQRYRELDHGADAIDTAAVFGSADGLVPVDANIVSHEEFLQIRDRFAGSVADDIDHDLAPIAWLILTLAYRCGLRRMEALKLELADVLVASPAELLVRPTEARRLKTKSSTRKMPLYALLDAEEMARLKAWHGDRLEAERKRPYSRFLFALPHRDLLFVSQDGLFRLIHAVMREVTGDPTLRYHHLRHTFASRSQITLALGTAANPNQLAASLPNFALAPKQSQEFRAQLYGNTRMTRRDIWAVSVLLGHASPDISLQHYIHLLDLTLADHLRQSDIAPSIAAVAEALGKSTAQAYRYQNKTGLSDWIAHEWKRYQMEASPNRKMPPAPKSEKQITTKAPSAGLADPIYRIWRLLLLHDVRQRPLTDLAESYGIDIKRLEQYVANARWLHDMRTSKTGTNFRHRFKELVPDKRHPGQKRRILCPAKPHEHRDLELIEEFVPKMRQAMEQDKALVARVLYYYVSNARTNFAGMIFTDPSHPEPARDFLAWLAALGIHKRNLRLISYDVSSQRSPYPGQWRKALNLPRAQVIAKLAPPNGRKDWPCPWFGIEPVFPDETGAYTGTAAFRFCMVMAFIAVARSGAR